MIPVSTLQKDAARYSQTSSLQVDIFRGNTLIYPDIPVSGGKLSSDRSRKTRLMADVDIALANQPELDISQNIHRFRIKRGLKSIGLKAEIQHGFFRIDEITRNDDGSASLKGSGLEQYIIDARFLRPRTPPRGVSTTGHISTLIKEVLPNATVKVECSTNKPIQARAPWEKERWDAIELLADSINADVYADWRGYFVIRDKPDITANITPVYFLKEGPGETLMSRDEKTSRDTVYNAAVVSGQSSDPNIPPVYGVAIDDDPASPTYFYGDFGQVPIYYTSQFFTTDAQCVAYAKTLLAESRARNQSLSVTTLPLTFLEADDVVVITLKDKTQQRRMLDKVSFDLGVNSAVDMDTIFMSEWPT